MQTRTVLERQFLGCGYLPAPSENLRASVDPWDHPGRQPSDDEVDENGEILTPVCVGYLLRMPEVREVAVARPHWSKGQLEHWAEGKPSQHLLEALTVLESAVNAVDNWRVTPASKGGGGPG